MLPVFSNMIARSTWPSVCIPCSILPAIMCALRFYTMQNTSLLTSGERICKGKPGRIFPDLSSPINGIFTRVFQDSYAKPCTVSTAQLYWSNRGVPSPRCAAGLAQWPLVIGELNQLLQLTHILLSILLFQNVQARMQIASLCPMRLSNG